MKNKIINFQNRLLNNTFLYLSLIYLLIFFQYPIGAAISSEFLNSPLPLELKSNIAPNHLLLWGGIRLFAILPLIFTLLMAEGKTKSIFLQLGDKNRMFKFTFWGTFIFILLGIFLYPNFLAESKLTINNLLLFSPYFVLFAISNAFVEEVFFRGALLTYLNEKVNFPLSNFLQAFLFATIHFTGAALTSRILLFVLLTFILGLLWGWLTKVTKSLIPAIILHIIGDIFVAISLF